MSEIPASSAASDAPLDTAHYTPDEMPLDPRDSVCSNCGCIAGDHAPGRYSRYGICPDGMLRASAAQRGSSLHDFPLTEDVRRGPVIPPGEGDQG